jgi:hypothetical protein
VRCTHGCRPKKKILAEACFNRLDCLTVPVHAAARFRDRRQTIRHMPQPGTCLQRHLHGRSLTLRRAWARTSDDKKEREMATRMAVPATTVAAVNRPPRLRCGPVRQADGPAPDARRFQETAITPGAMRAASRSGFLMLSWRSSLSVFVLSSRPSLPPISKARVFPPVTVSGAIWESRDSCSDAIPDRHTD